jgi:hypothetical protein
MQDRDWEKGYFRLRGPIAQNETLGGGKGYFSGIFGLPFFQAHRYMTQGGARNEIKKQKSGIARINRLHLKWH